MADGIIKINNTRENDLEFEVSIQGVNPENPENGAQVRFVISGMKGYEMSFACERVADSSTQWHVKLPSLSQLEKDSYTFRIEVIIDGYFFVPAEGNLIFVKDPKVALPLDKKRPSVNAIIKTAENEDEKKDEEKKQDTDREKDEKVQLMTKDDKRDNTDDKKKDKEKEKEQANESKRAEEDEEPGHAATTSPCIAPNNKLLKSEFPGTIPPKTAREHQGEQPENEELKDKQKRSVEETASKIIAETIGNRIKAPDKKGFLFKRTKDGDTVVNGLENPKLKETLLKKAAKVKKILNS